ncbi:MAG: type I-B CRISPR-associated protein Cas5 [Bacillus thermozeamaize]|uniref:Type I-B CRISPR-associated protein Cas5 n=1 Tax=Bacillus thermozeamaize TaxID=230954 RepID=A0A1Y3PMH4_9BACI|nr:MAG: type I-B CRISPR-associated protein Cas5 [Bacillus thermozeamaize]
MKALRLGLFQETACYKKPFAFKVGETYPLPPYSTVKGWLHALLGAEQLIPMHLSIQGSYEAKMLDYQAHYFVKEQQSNEFPLILDGLPGIQEYQFSDMTQMPLYVHLLYRVKLLIHVVTEEAILHRLIQQVETASTHFSLGRWEDLVRVDEYGLVDLEELSESKENSYDAYVPVDKLSFETQSIPYRLNWTYEIRNGVRHWRTVDVGYVPKGTTFDPGDLLVDDHGELVFLFPEIDF